MEQESRRASTQRIERRINELAQIVDRSFQGWTRSAFTESYERARLQVGKWMESAGLYVRRDAGANLIGRLEGSEPNLPPIMVGSHTDTVKEGGRYDGIVGVLAGIELVEMLRISNTTLRHPLEIIDFTAEEPTEFGLSTIGSKAMAGNLTPEMLQRRDGSGRTLAAALREAGGNPDAIEAQYRHRGDVTAYLELHIEQGPVLEAAGCELGVVNGIVGIDRFVIELIGSPDHAGTTPMDRRRDALCGASEIIVAMEGLCRSEPGRDLVGTVGRIDLAPNAPNVIPGRATLNAELRSTSDQLIESTGERLLKEIKGIAAARQLEFRARRISHTEPVQIEAPIRACIGAACTETGTGWMELVSGAGHDANQVAHFAPVGMIFIPSIGGRSHCPEEASSIAHIVKGTAALLRSIIKIDQQQRGTL